jgi:hypothetical protein
VEHWGVIVDVDHLDDEVARGCPAAMNYLFQLK